jgi:hypothetical protein
VDAQIYRLTGRRVGIFHLHKMGSSVNLFHPELSGEPGWSGGDMAKRLVVGVVISLNTPAAGGLRWFRILPRSMSGTSWSSMSLGSSTPEGVNAALVGAS